MTTIRKLELLHPALQRIIKAWNSKYSDKLYIDKEGVAYFGKLVETFRTPQRQIALKAQNKVVTNASAWESAHQFGLAFDMCFCRPEVTFAWPEGELWTVLKNDIGECAHGIANIKWLGHIGDLGHYELVTRLSMAEMKKINDEEGLLSLWNRFL